MPCNKIYDSHSRPCDVPWSGGNLATVRIYESINVLLFYILQAQEQLEKSTGRRPVKKIRGVMPLVNVRALQSERDLLEESNLELQADRNKMTQQLALTQEKVHVC